MNEDGILPSLKILVIRLADADLYNDGNENGDKSPP